MLKIITMPNQLPLDYSAWKVLSQGVSMHNVFTEKQDHRIKSNNQNDTLLLSIQYAAGRLNHQTNR